MTVPVNFGTKVCTGPSHPQPTRLPLDDRYWSFHGSGAWATANQMVGKPLARCKLCRSWDRLVVKEGPHGLVPAAKVRPFAQELVERCGSRIEVTRRYGVSRNTLDRLALRQTSAVKAATVARILVALGEQRKVDRRNGASAVFVAARRAQGLRAERLERLSGY